MTLDTLLAGLEARGIRLTAWGDRLRVEAPLGVVTPALLDQLRTRKPELLRLLAASPEGEEIVRPLPLDPVAVREVLGDRPGPEAVLLLQNEMTAALTQLQEEIRSGRIGRVPIRVRGVPLALWLPLEEVARLLAGVPLRRRREGSR